MCERAEANIWRLIFRRGGDRRGDTDQLFSRSIKKALKPLGVDAHRVDQVEHSNSLAYHKRPNSCRRTECGGNLGGNYAIFI